MERIFVFLRRWESSSKTFILAFYFAQFSEKCPFGKRKNLFCVSRNAVIENATSCRLVENLFAILGEECDPGGEMLKLHKKVIM